MERLKVIIESFIPIFPLCVPFDWGDADQRQVHIPDRSQHTVQVRLIDKLAGKRGYRRAPLVISLGKGQVLKPVAALLVEVPLDHNSVRFLSHDLECSCSRTEQLHFAAICLCSLRGDR